MSEFEGFPPCADCLHPATSHDDEFGNCKHLPGKYHPSNRDGCDCEGYAEPEEQKEATDGR